MIKFSSGASVLAIAALTATPAFAQDADASAERQGGVDDIVVTATGLRLNVLGDINTSEADTAGNNVEVVFLGPDNGFTQVLSGDIRTTGDQIIVEDSAQIGAGASITYSTVEASNSGANITIKNNVFGAGAATNEQLTFNAGSGDILFSGKVGVKEADDADNNYPFALQTLTILDANDILFP